MLCIRPLAKPPFWENENKYILFSKIISVVKYCVSTCANPVTKTKEKTDVKNYTLGTIISASIPRAEACRRSCVNLIEERTANGDGCWCSFTLSTRKKEKEKKFILVLKGRNQYSETIRITKHIVPSTRVQRNISLDCKYGWAGVSSGFIKSSAKESL